ncbi:MAG: hypothetical protein KF902_15040 [Phycisphaeraceae bacterium]|nr:hypothetical protein [Phycisphaeraceae bacterium]
MAKPTSPTGESWSKPAPKRKPPKLLRLALFIGLPLLLIIVGGIALIPTIASSLAPGIISAAASDSLDGSASVSKVRLTWTGPQTIESLIVKDNTDREILRADVRATTSLLSLVFGSRSIGDIRLSGSALVVRDKSGNINLAQLIGADTKKPGTGGSSGGRPSPAPPTTGQPTRLPTSLAAKLVIDELSLTYVDESRAGTPGGAIGIWSVRGNADFAVGKPLDLTLNADFAHGPSAVAALRDGGTLAINASIKNLTASDGELTIPDASGDVSIALRNISTIGLDALLDQKGNLTDALGKSIALELKASGSANDGSVTLTAASDAVTADLALALKNNVLSLTRRGTIEARSARLVALAPDIRAQLSSEQTMLVQSWPDITATLDALSIRIPKGSAPLDLRKGAIALTIATTETAGKVAIPGPDGSSIIRPFSVAPASIALNAPDLAQSISIKGGTSATIGDNPAGSLAIDTTVSGLLDAKGSPVAGLPASIASAIDIKDFATAIIEPLVTNPKIRLADDIGPSLSARIVANSASTPGQKLPSADAAITIDAKNITSRASLRLSDNVLVAGPDGLTLTVVSAGPLLERFLSNAGLAINRGAGIDASITGLRADLSRLAPPPNPSTPTASTPPDLRALAATLTVTVGQTQGSMKLPGEPQRTPFTLQPFTLLVDASNLAKAARITASGSAFMAGSPAGTLRAELEASILDANGAPLVGIPDNLNGTFSLRNASTKALQPLASATGLILAEDIGETLNIEGWAKPSALAGRTDVSLGVNAQKLQLGAQLDLSPTEIRTREQGIKITAQDLGRILARLAPADQASFTPTGSAQILVQNVAIPLDKETGSPRLDKAGAQLTVTASDLRATLKSAEGATQPFALDSSRLALALTPGGPPTLDLQSRMSIGDKPSVASGALKFNNLFNPDGSINATGVRPEGRIELADVPTVLASLAGKDLASLITEALGQTVSAQLAATPEAANTAIRATINASSGTTLTSTATLKPDEISVGAVNAKANVSPRLLATLAKDNPSVPRLSSPASFDVALDPFVLPLRGTALDETKLAGKRIKASVTGNASFSDFVIASSEPNTPARRTGPINLSNIRLVADAPLAALAPAPETSKPERATVSLNASLAQPQGESIGAIVATADVGLRGPAPAGPASASARVENVSSAFVDRFLATPDMLVGSLGARFQAAATANFAQFPTGEDLKNLGVNVRMSSERVTFSDVATIRLRPDRLELAKPVTIDWKPSPAWATRYMLGQSPASPSDAPSIRFVEGPPVTIALTSLAIAMGDNESTGKPIGPMLPGVFALDASVGIANAALAMADGNKITLKDINASVARAPADPSAITFKLRTLPVGASAAGAKPVTFDGTITKLADAAGNITPDDAELTAKGNIAGLPTALVDAIADQDGRLVEFLGPIVNMDLDADRLNKRAGRLAATLNADHANAVVRGTIRDGLFIADGSTGAQVKIITPALGHSLTEGVPLVGSLEKRATDAPATLTTARLEVPTTTETPEDLRRLNGDLTLDLGDVRFETGGAFQSVLKTVGQRDRGTVGRRLQPLRVKITNGVVSYDRFVVPLGEFNIDTEGTYDLVTKRVDFLTWIPAGALADEAAGLFNTGLGGLLGGSVKPIERLTMLPWRTSGTVGGKLDTKPDLQLFLKTTGQNLIKEPGKLIEGGLQDLLKNLPGSNRPGGGGG